MKQLIINTLIIILILTSPQLFAQFTNYKTSNSPLPNNFVHVSKMDANNNLWIGTEGGLTKFDGTTWHTYTTTNSNLPSNWIQSIEIVDTNEIWIGTRAADPGLCLFDGDTIIHFDTINGIATPTDIYALKKDANGNLWIGGDYDTYKYDGTNLINIGFSGPHYANSFIINNGVLWAGCYGNGLYKYDGSTWTNYNMSNSGIPSDFMEKIVIDNNNNIWMGGFGSNSDVKGLTMFDGTNWVNYNTSNSNIPRNPIHDLVIDDYNNIWIANGDGNNPGGLVKFDGTDFTLTNTSNSNLPTNIILDLDIDNFNKLTLSTYAQGICTYNLPTPPPCNITANYSFQNNGNGNYSFTNNSTGVFTDSHWAYGDGNISLSTNSNHTFNTNGTYVVALTIKNTATINYCSTYFLDTINITGVPANLTCNAGFVVYPDIVSGDITIVNSATGNSLSYLWNFGDGNTSNQQNPSHTYNTSGPFNLCLTVNDGAGCINTYCDSITSNGILFKQTAFTINIIPTSITTNLSPILGLLKEVKVNPNPAINQLFINTPYTIDEVSITNIFGKVIMRSKGSKKINVSNLKPGIYIVKLNIKGKIITKKFIKQ